MVQVKNTICWIRIKPADANELFFHQKGRLMVVREPDSDRVHDSLCTWIYAPWPTPPIAEPSPLEDETNGAPCMTIDEFRRLCKWHRRRVCVEDTDCWVSIYVADAEALFTDHMGMIDVVRESDSDRRCIVSPRVWISARRLTPAQKLRHLERALLTRAPNTAGERVNAGL